MSERDDVPTDWFLAMAAAVDRVAYRGRVMPSPMTYKMTARFDDGLFDIDEDGNWRKIGPPNAPCRCLACVTSRR
jgi:hypothetical protein